MMNPIRRSCILAFPLFAALAAACAAHPQHDERPVNPDAKQPAPGAPAKPGEDPHAKPMAVAGLAFTIPSAFQKVEVPEAQRQMRAAQFTVHAPDDSGLENGEIVFFYFGPQGAGGVEANIQRWSSQVLDSAGKPAEPKLRVEERNGIKMTEASFHGTYQSGMPGAAKTPKAGHTLVGAIFEGGPKGMVVARFTGPEGVVKAQHELWERMLASVRAEGQ